MSRLFLCVIIASSLLGCESPPPSDGSAPSSTTKAAPGPSKINGAKARELVAAGAVLLDVRTQGEWDGGHLDGATLVPVHELGRRMSEVGPKDKAVVVYCASGIRSARAASQLAKAGWSEVYDLGGMGNW